MITDDEVKNLPDASGVYIFRDGQGSIIYIGKAKSLRNRVKNYTRGGGHDAKTERLITQIAGLETVLTTSEKEAFLLENNLIKEHRPKYNVFLKDDKTYVSLKLTVNDPYPGLFITRKIEDDGAAYFGPYPQVGDIRDILKVVQGYYPVRLCKNTVFRKRKRPCMLHQIGRCLAPCGDNIDERQYREIVSELADLLSGRNDRILKALEEKIRRAATEWKFEEAAALKERYGAIRGMTERQHVHEHLGRDRDVWAFEETEKGLRSVVLRFHKGVLTGKRLFQEGLPAVSFGESVGTLLFQFYSSRNIPDEILLSEEIEDREALERYLKDRRKSPLRVLGPRSRQAKEVLPLAIENLHEPEKADIRQVFRHTLRLKTEPRRIEIYDISHTRGKSPTGVMVVYDSFKTDKKSYRVFHIRDADPMDDPAMMAEVLRRRLTNEDMRPYPDLIVIDGGKGQLSAVSKVMRELHFEMDIIGIAKGERRKRLQELIYIPGRKNPLSIPQSSQVLKELARMRDEAHRFAITSHKKWKTREDFA